MEFWCCLMKMRCIESCEIEWIGSMIGVSKWYTLKEAGKTIESFVGT